MKQNIILICTFIVLLTGCQIEQNTTPIFTKIHTVSIHVKDHTVHEAVYCFLKDDLQLPVVYTPVMYGERKYAGLWAGNVVLEPCGPYSNMTYAAPDFTAIFCGITFESYQSSKQSAIQLDQRGIIHAPPYAFVVISDPNLCGQNLIVSIMDNPGREKEQIKHDTLTVRLRNDPKNPLGIQYVEEVQVGYTNQQNLNKWKNFLSPIRPFDQNQWHLGKGPSIRLVKSEIKEIPALVFKVASLKLAARYLESRSIMSKKDANSIIIQLPESWDFTIVLQQ